MTSAEEVVLVVEDDVDQREALASALTSEGFRTVAVPNGRAALDLLEHEDPPPRIIVLDLAMPVMNGWKFLEEQRRRPGLAGIPTVVVTAYDLGYARDRGVGDVDVLPKPFTIETLLDAIRRHVPARAA